jgi:hypothetical protein
MMSKAPWSNIPVLEGRPNTGGSGLPWRVREAAGSTDDDLAAFRKLSGGDRPDGLDQSTYERYQRLAFWLYYSNPLARRLCDIPTDICLGAGLNIDSEKNTTGEEVHTKVKELIERFLCHPKNRFETRLPSLFSTLNVVSGELFLPVFVSPQNGDIALSWLEHHKVQDVLFDPKDPMEAVAVIQRPPGAGKKPVWWNVIRAEMGQDQPMFPPHPELSGKAPEMERGIATHEELIGKPPTPEDYDYGGELFYFSANGLGPGRGRTQLEPALDWLHAYDEFLFGDLRNANMQAAFVWDVEITGADDSTLSKRAAEMQENPPRPGETIFHNEKEKWAALSPNLNAASHSELGAQVKRLIGLSTGLPDHLIGAGEKVNRTSASSSDMPFVRRMEQKQRLLQYVVRTILDYQLDQKAHKGLLDAVRPYPYKIVLPSITAGEIVAAAEALYNVTLSLVEAVNNGFTTPEEAQRLWYALGVQEAGVPKDLMKLVKKAREDGLMPDPVADKKAELEAKVTTGQPAMAGGKIGKGQRVIRSSSSKGGPSGASRGQD